MVKRNRSNRTFRQPNDDSTEAESIDAPKSNILSRSESFLDRQRFDRTQRSLFAESIVCFRHRTCFRLRSLLDRPRFVDSSDTIRTNFDQSSIIFFQPNRTVDIDCSFHSNRNVELFWISNQSLILKNRTILRLNRASSHLGQTFLCQLFDTFFGYLNQTFRLSKSGSTMLISRSRSTFSSCELERPFIQFDDQSRLVSLGQTVELVCAIDKTRIPQVKLIAERKPNRTSFSFRLTQ